MKPMDEEFNSEKLAEYVIEVMFFLHSGFNLKIKSITSPSDSIISPKVAITIIGRLKKNKRLFFRQNECINEAKGFMALDIFTNKNYQPLKPEALKVLRELIWKGKVQVINYTLYPERRSIYELEPQYVLFKQGLVSVSETKTIKQIPHITLKVPNHVVRKYLFNFYKEVSQIQKNSIDGFLDPQTKYEDRKQIVYYLFMENLNQVHANAVSKLTSGQDLIERNFSSFFANYFNKLLKGSSIKINIQNFYSQLKAIERQVMTEQSILRQKQTKKTATNKFCAKSTVPEARTKKYLHRKKRDPKNSPLLPDLTIFGKGYMQGTLIEIYRNKDKKKHAGKVKKYEKLDGQKIGWIVVVGYDNEFKKIIQFEIDLPGSNQEKMKEKEENKRQQEEKEENQMKQKEVEQKKQS